MTTKVFGFALVIALFALAMPASSRADGFSFSITFLDSTDTLQWTNGPFTFACPAEGTACIASEEFFNGTFAATDLAFNIFDSVGGALSDTLHITASGGSDTVFATFNSDAEGVAPTPLANATSLIEDGTVQTAATLPIGGAFAGSSIAIKFQSDVESSTAVPEPSSIALLGAGLIGLMGLGLRMRRPALV